MESAKDRLARMFNMGKYGEELAQDILDQYIQELADAWYIDVPLLPWPPRSEA